MTTEGLTLEQIKSLNAEGKLHGLFAGIPDTTYHHAECPGKSSSYFKRMLHATPMHAEASTLRVKKDAPALAFGRYFHDVVEFPDHIKNYVALPDGMKRDARSAKYQEFLQENAGKQVLTQDELDRLKGMRDAVLTHPLYHLMADCLIEYSGWWKDAETGVLCKFRPDFLRKDGVIFDLKSTGELATTYSFSKTVHGYGYHVSAALYLEGISAIWNERMKHFVMIAVEKDAPHGCVFFDLDEAAIEKGREDLRKAMRIYAECKAAGKFPGYPEDFQIVSLPAYAWSLT